MMRVRTPMSPKAAARLAAVVVLPSLGLGEVTMMTFGSGVPSPLAAAALMRRRLSRNRIDDRADRMLSAALEDEASMTTRASSRRRRSFDRMGISAMTGRPVTASARWRRRRRSSQASTAKAVMMPSTRPVPSPMRTRVRLETGAAVERSVSLKLRPDEPAELEPGDRHAGAGPCVAVGGEAGVEGPGVDLDRGGALQGGEALRWAALAGEGLELLVGHPDTG